MRKRSLWIFSVLILFSCNNPKNQRATTIKPLLTINSNKYTKLLRGRWCGVRDTVSGFQIDKDEIFYYDAVKYYKYVLSDKILIIRFDDWTSKSRIKFKGNDTLIIIGLGKEKGVNDTMYRCVH